jgi:hypothetical protein
MPTDGYYVSMIPFFFLSMLSTMYMQSPLFNLLCRIFALLLIRAFILTVNTSYDLLAPIIIIFFIFCRACFLNFYIVMEELG